MARQRPAHAEPGRSASARTASSPTSPTSCARSCITGDSLRFMVGSILGNRRPPGRGPASCSSGAGHLRRQPADRRAPRTPSSCAARSPTPRITAHRHLRGRAAPGVLGRLHRGDLGPGAAAVVRRRQRAGGRAAPWPSTWCGTSATRSRSSSPRRGPRPSTPPSWSTSTTTTCRWSIDIEAAAGRRRSPAVRGARLQRRRPAPRHRRRSDPFDGADARGAGADGQPADRRRARSRATRSWSTPSRRRRPRLTAWVSTQHPHLARDLLAECTRPGPRTQVRVVAPHVGGAFGGKAGIGTDHARSRSPPPAARAAGRRGPRPAARRCSRCTAAARCSTPSSG